MKSDKPPIVSSFSWFTRDKGEIQGSGSTVMNPWYCGGTKMGPRYREGGIEYTSTYSTC